MEGHVLHPGQVDRYVEQYGTQIGVRTHGTGEGSLATLNERLSPLVWGINALEIRSDYVRNRGRNPI